MTNKAKRQNEPFRKANKTPGEDEHNNWNPLIQTKWTTAKRFVKEWKRFAFVVEVTIQESDPKGENISFTESEIQEERQQSRNDSKKQRVDCAFIGFKASDQKGRKESAKRAQNYKSGVLHDQQGETIPETLNEQAPVVVVI